MTDTPEKPDNETAGEQPPAYGFFGALVRTMVRHRNAANLCMVIAVALGLYGLSIINRQFFPDFEIEVVSVTIVWPGASAEDVDINTVSTSLLMPLFSKFPAVHAAESLHLVSLANLPDPFYFSSSGLETFDTSTPWERHGKYGHHHHP